MAKRKPSEAFLKAAAAHQFKPGHTGRPVGTRNKLGEAFVAALHADFIEHGKTAIIEARTDDPVGYLRVLAGILPKELEIKRPLGELTDDELINAIELIRAAIAKHPGELGSGASHSDSADETQTVRTLQ